jgi:hypothetical protein
MDAGTASVIAAVISAVASIFVAVITTRVGKNASISVAPLIPSSSIPSAQPHHAEVLRRIGWGLIVFLYAFGIFLIGATIHFRNDPFRFGPQTIPINTLGVKIPLEDSIVICTAGIDIILLSLISGEFCICVAFWATRRLLRRHSPAASPQST